MNNEKQHIIVEIRQERLPKVVAVWFLIFALLFAIFMAGICIWLIRM